jgi:hypothetical protein
MVVVQPGEALWTIAARAGLTLQALLALNNLPENAIIQPGDQLIIGTGTPGVPPSPTADPSVTITATLSSLEEARPTLLPPTPRPSVVSRRTAAICLSAFDDLNRNSQQEADEPLKGGVAFTLFNAAAVVGNYITDGVSEPYCFSDLPVGEYHVTRSLAPGEVLTTAGDWALVLTADNQLTQAFGSYSDPGATPPNVAATAAALSALASSPTPASSSQTTDIAAANLEAAAEPPAPSEINWLVVGLMISLLILAAVLILLIRQIR